MDFSKNIKAFLGTLPIKKLNGQQMFLAVAAYCAKGDKSNEVSVAEVKDNWSKSLFQKKYNPGFYGRAQGEGWVSPVRQGSFTVESDGFECLEKMSESDNRSGMNRCQSGILIFNKRSAHSFDKFLRNIFSGAKSKVFVADSWVDDTIFDNLLDSIPKSLEIKLIYGQKRGVFDSRVSRFKKEYTKFVIKRYADLHDRFMIVDDVGYVIGPSLKDAADKSPSLIVVLESKDSILLDKFFQALWINSKADTLSPVIARVPVT